MEYNVFGQNANNANITDSVIEFVGFFLTPSSWSRQEVDIFIYHFVYSLCLSSNVPLLSFLQPFMSPRYPGGPRPSLRMPNQPPGSIPGSQPLLPNSLDPTRPQGIDKPSGVIVTSYCFLNSLSHSTCFRYRTSKHGRSNENESPSRHGRHGPTGRYRCHWSDTESSRKDCVDKVMTPQLPHRQI